MTTGVGSPIQQLKNAAEKLQALLPKEGALSGRKITPKFPAKNAATTIQDNLPVLEKKILEVEKALSETFTKEDLEIAKNAVDVLDNVRKNFKIKEYPGKPGFLLRIESWICKFFGVKLYVRVDDKAGTGLRDRVNELMAKLKGVITSRKEEVPHPASPNPEETKTPIEKRKELAELHKNVIVAEKAGAQKRAQEELLKVRKEIGARDDRMRREDKGEASFERLASRTKTLHSEDVEHVKKLARNWDKVLFWGETTEAGGTVLHTFSKGKEEKKPVVKGSVNVGGVAVTSVEELRGRKTNDFVSLERVVACYSRLKPMIDETKRWTKDEVEEQLTLLKGFVKEGQVVVKIWQDNDGLHMGTLHDGAIEFHSLDLQHDPGMVDIVPYPEDTEEEVEAFGRPEEQEESDVEDRVRVEEVNISEAWIKRGLSQLWIDEEHPESMEVLVDSGHNQALSGIKKALGALDQMRGKVELEDYKQAVKSDPRRYASTYFFRPDKYNKWHLEVLNKDSKLSSFEIDCTAIPGKFLINGAEYNSLEELLSELAPSTVSFAERHKTEKK